MKEKTDTQGTLFIVATPIGNLEDITLRALRVLKEVDLIAAEDTRHTKKLLNHFQIETRLISYYREKERERGTEIITKLKAGQDIALVSDAGTPGLSDPGTILVNMAYDQGICVTPIPGPSALTAALSASGLGENGFLFLGFPPNKKSARIKLLRSLIHASHPVIFYESPRRVSAFLADALEILGERPLLWAREITKSHEDLQRSSLRTIEIESKQLKGEFVLIIGAAEAPQSPEGADLNELLHWYHANTTLSVKDVSQKLAADLGFPRSQVYQQALIIWKGDMS